MSTVIDFVICVSTLIGYSLSLLWTNESLIKDKWHLILNNLSLLFLPRFQVNEKINYLVELSQ